MPGPFDLSGQNITIGLQKNTINFDERKFAHRKSTGTAIFKSASGMPRSCYPQHLNPIVDYRQSEGSTNEQCVSGIRVVNDEVSFITFRAQKYNTSMEQEKNDIQRLGMLLLRAGRDMQSSGACTVRIRIAIERMANAYGYFADLYIIQRAITLTLFDQKEMPIFTSMKKIPPPGVNFKVVSGISRMSLKIHHEPWPLTKIEEELAFLEKLPHYPRAVVLTMVSMAGAGFCTVAGGNIYAVLLAFGATFAGLFVRQEATRMKFNPYLCVFFASLSATLIAGAFRKLFPGVELEKGFAASVLFLIPGVPFINSFLDFIDGNLLNGISRLTNSLLISLMIAFGMICSISIFRL